MKEYNGFNNQLLRVNLTEKTVEKERIGEKVLRKYIGGTSTWSLLYAEGNISQNRSPESR